MSARPTGQPVRGEGTPLGGHPCGGIGSATNHICERVKTCFVSEL